MLGCPLTSDAKIGHLFKVVTIESVCKSAKHHL